MSEAKPTDRSEAAEEYADAIRREGRRHRQSLARAAWLYFDTYGWEKARIAEALDLDSSTLDRLITVDGVVHCVECAFTLHRSCMHELNFGPFGERAACGCSCDEAGFGV